MTQRTGHFVQRQAREVRVGGLSVLVRKVLTSLGMALAALPVLLVRALRPVVVVRFGPLRCERIGHFGAETEVYLCESDAGFHGRRTLDLFYYRSPVCNHQLDKMWRRTLHVGPRFLRPLDQVNRRLPGGQTHVIPWRRDQDSDIHGLISRTPTHLSFTPAEERLGREGLKEMGVPEGVPFVCFHARDPAYLDAVLPGRDWRYHNYRDSNIHHCVPAAEELARRGYFSFRMGAVAKEPLTSTNQMVVDYAAKHRTDFLDIYLGAKCRFFICSDAGIYAIPYAFRRPIAFVNVIPLEDMARRKQVDMFIPKKIWSRREQRLMTFREVLESGVGRILGSEGYERLDLEPVENTPEEITGLAVEMDERINRTWRTTEEDDELQRRFWSHFKPPESVKEPPTLIGADFLRRNRELLA